LPPGDVPRGKTLPPASGYVHQADVSGSRGAVVHRTNENLRRAFFSETYPAVKQSDISPGEHRPGEKIFIICVNLVSEASGRFHFFVLITHRSLLTRI